MASTAYHVVVFVLSILATGCLVDAAADPHDRWLTPALATKLSSCIQSTKSYAQSVGNNFTPLTECVLFAAELSALQIADVKWSDYFYQCASKKGSNPTAYENWAQAALSCAGA
ncbi:hypothetical protein FOCC_FOCC013884 [Frankliniella occidentalis]|uniref:Uncharacterized protein LOC127750773 n=1 Tax=Frankliniella occidentalis TaxID=133901 RepID=A0A9C6X4Z6_FRAOC|nr:uncharacterized protein LOC127750773 [Frankliniella occidentalis]KAE8740605.1 hypothetical protein FOCC_FOCC013884 [Frankliniella occidentalis]